MESFDTAPLSTHQADCAKEGARLPVREIDSHVQFMVVSAFNEQGFGALRSFTVAPAAGILSDTRRGHASGGISRRFGPIGTDGKNLLRKGRTLETLFAVADWFKPGGKILDIRPFGNGNVHDTFLVTTDAREDHRFILQRVNTQVFHRPELVMRNMRVATEHIRGRLRDAHPGAGLRWEVMRVLPARDGRDHCIDSEGSFWRATSFIEGAQSVETIEDTGHAREVGRALGLFQHLVSDLPPELLADTLEGFHVTPLYLQHYDRVLTCTTVGASPEVKHALRFVDERRAWAHVLEDAVARGRLVPRTIHGDPKVNNVMLDTATRRAVSMVDLDTVKPGLVHYDIGDCLRSGCNPLGEETENWEAVRFEPELCRAILEGYLPPAWDFLTENDRQYLFDAIRLIAFELGLRFFTDYLEGDVYFKVKRREHNLARALVQFRLTESIESQEKTIRNTIRDLV
jgi:Ser/Thr protein kinase RdoA (MazF antagonist)